ncbi:MAG: hypothetical protein R3326_06895 [Gemmatimonadota bacterium]|nr:hypothetical protein [Gemmatimonadota bacterium]
MRRVAGGGSALPPALGLIVAAVALAALACGADREEADETIRLRFEYSEGDTLRYAYHASGTAVFPDTAAGDERVERPFERTMEIEEVATDVTPAGHYELALVYHIRPDSLHRDKGPQEIRLRLEITPQGRILDVTGVETARPLYGEIDFQSYFEQSQPVFPDRGLEVGDSWTQEVKVVSPESEPVVTSSTYVLEEVIEEGGRELAVIGYDGDIYLPVRYTPPSDSAPGEEDRTTSIEERIRVRGQIYFDHAAGVMRRVEAKAEATFTRRGFRDGEPVRREMKIREESTMELISADR